MTSVAERTIELNTGNAVGPEPVVKVNRRMVDRVLVWLGTVVTVVLIVAGGLLMWGSNFAGDYVQRELAAQSITFGTADALAGQGRQDLVKYAGKLVDTGDEAEAYASYIGGHVKDIAEGKTYAELGGPERAARAAVQDAQTKGASATEITKLQEAADTITTQRDSIFRGEMLRGTLLNTYAWSTIGRIAGIASIAAWIAAAAMAVLVVLGFGHLRKLHR